MNFASKHVWAYDLSDEEVVSEEDLEEGLSASRMVLSSSSEDEMDECCENSHDSIAQKKKKHEEPQNTQSPKRKSGFFSFLYGMGGGGSKAAPEAPPSPALNTKSEAIPKQKRKKKLKRQTYGSSRNASDPLPRLPRTWRQADTNVVSIKFDHLTAPGNMHTGDPVYCSKCKSVFSHLSKLQQQGEDQIWLCEFCEERNLVDLMEEEKPTKDDVTFMLEPAPSTTASGKSGTDESLVIFCVDISGSMGVTTEVPGIVRLRGSERLAQLQSLNETRENQRLPRQRRDVTYVSRLQGVQAGVDHHLGEMSKHHANRRPALITFNNEVNIIGDGSSLPITLSGDVLLDWTRLVEEGNKAPMPHAVEISRKNLGEKVFELEEDGATALGPALLVSVAMASQVPGSKVIICTDGKANVGLGSLDVKPEDFEESSKFYGDVSNYALEKGVSVSVLSIEGTDCKMVELGRVASITGGQVNIVDPLKLTQEFGSILSDPIIATGVTASFILHKGLYIRHEENQESCAIRHVGNVTAESEITFEFGIRTSNSENKPPEKEKTVVADATPCDDPCPSGSEAGAASAPHKSSSHSTSIKDLHELPFQLQITYTDLEGAKALRVISKVQPVTRERKVAESSMDVAVLGVHAAQTSAQMAMHGTYTNARLLAISHKNMIRRHTKTKKTMKSQYEVFYNNLMPIERHLYNVQKNEVASVGRKYSDDEDEADTRECALVQADCVAPAPLKKLKSKKPFLRPLYSSRTASTVDATDEVSVARKHTCDDFTANMMYNNIRAKSRDFRKALDSDSDKHDA